MMKTMIRAMSIAALTIFALAGLAPVTTTAQTPEATAVCGGANTEAAFAWMATVQNADGGFSNGFSPDSDAGATADAVVAIAAAGGDVTAFVKGNSTPLDYLAAQLKVGEIDNVGLMGKVLLATAATEADLSTTENIDLIKRATDALAADDGKLRFNMALGVLGVVNAGAEVPATAAETLLKAQEAQGGWAFIAESAADTNTTALVIQALLASQNTEVATPVENALAYLRSIQNEDGGWPYQNPSEYGTVSDANSTAIIIQTLIALEEGLADYNSPEQFLLSLQQADGGFAFQPGQPSSFLATVAALPALCGVSLVDVTPQAEAAQ